MRKKSAIIFILFIFAQLLNTSAQKPNISVSLFKDSAFAGTWSRYDSTLVAYNLPFNGYYNIYFANINAANQRLNERCFTCGNSLLPGKNVGSPSFQSTGKYIAMAVEKANHPGASTNSVPGIGQYNDLWVMTMDGTKAYQLTNTSSSADTASGVIFPLFSPDGKKVMWTEMTAPVSIWDGKQYFGFWVIKTADFIEDSLAGPHLSNILTLQPGGVPAFNEGYGWSPDGSRIIFASCYNQFWVWADQIYTMDTLGNDIRQMSSTAVNYPYCEHAFYSTDGQYIIWMTNRDNMVGSTVGGNDWWIMKSDTTNQQRLTYFNDTTSSYWTGAAHINGFGCFSPDGKKFIGDVGGNSPIQLDTTQIGRVYIVDMTNFLTDVDNIEPNLESCRIYPNPARTHFKIELNGTVSKIHYSMHNLLGSIIAEGDFIGHSHALNVRNYPSGVYVLRLSDGQTEFTKKVLVTNE